MYVIKRKGFSIEVDGRSADRREQGCIISTLFSLCDAQHATNNARVQSPAWPRSYPLLR